MLLRWEYLVEPPVTMRTPISSPLVSTSATTWLRRALLVSVLLHVVGAAVGHFVVPSHDASSPAPSLIDVELAPPAPKAEALPEKALAAATQAPTPPPAPVHDDEKPSPPDDEPGEGKTPDAGMVIADARMHIDARVHADARVRADASLDAGADAAPMVATTTIDAGIDALPQLAILIDAGTPRDGSAPQVAASEPNGQSRNPFIAPHAPPGPAEFTDGAPSLVAPGTGPTTAVGEPGAVASAGTTANLLAYMPPSHMVTVLLRFDRLRGTVWADAAIAVLRLASKSPQS